MDQLCSSVCGNASREKRERKRRGREREEGEKEKRERERLTDRQGKVGNI